MSEGIATQATLVAAIARASRAEVSAYVLGARSPIVRALESAADRGAQVSVRLEGAPYGGGRSDDGMAARNRATAEALARHGVAVRLTAPDDASTHMKAAVVDGTAFLDDRNWPSDGSDTILTTDEPADVALVTTAFEGVPGSGGHLATEKSAALALEAAAIAGRSGDRVEVESETFGFSSVSKALYARARAGAHVRLLVSTREFAAGGRTERSALHRLAGAGVEIRLTANDEKLCVAGDRAWAGSANATFAPAPTLDWGMVTSNAATVRGIDAAFERNWRAGTAVAV